MKFKVFNVHLRDGYRDHDEATLNEFLENVTVNQVFASIVNETDSFWSVAIFYEEIQLNIEEPISSDEDSLQDIILTLQQEKVYQALKRWRSEKATQEGIPAYMIAHNTSLKQMITMPVKTKDDFLRVKGFRERLTRKYGDEILKILEEESNASQNYLDF